MIASQTATRPIGTHQCSAACSIWWHSARILKGDAIPTSYTRANRHEDMPGRTQRSVAETGRAEAPDATLPGVDQAAGLGTTGCVTTRRYT